MLDTKIINGVIVDGTGSPGRVGDLGVSDGRVVEMGSVVADAHETIDARGRIVAPGFVDVHTHYDAQAMWDRGLSVSPWHGVTTIVMGNCGFGVAPTRRTDRERMIQTLEKVEGMDAAALHAGLGDWGFESFPEYLDVLESGGTMINVAVLIGHSPLRLSVLGVESTERAATAEEVATMRGLVAEAMEAGAIGFSTSHSPAHVGFLGLPVPSRLATVEEIVEIAGVLHGSGGVVQAARGTMTWDDLAKVAASSGGQVSWVPLLAGDGGGDVWRTALEESSALMDAGISIRAQVSCRPLVMEFSMAAPFLFESARMMRAASEARTRADKIAVYRDADFRRRFQNLFDSGRAVTLDGCWSRTVVSWSPTDRSLEERTVADLAAEAGRHPALTALDLAVESGLEARFRMAVVNWNEDEVCELITDPHTLLSLSDAGADASQLCDAGYSTHLLGRWVREKGAMTIEEAVRRLTSEPADIFGLADRGRLAVGRPADVVILDPLTVGCSALRRVADQPGGAQRLVADAHGIDVVMVNGVVIRRDNLDTIAPGARLPGQLLRHVTRG